MPGKQAIISHVQNSFSFNPITIALPYTHQKF